MSAINLKREGMHESIYDGSGVDNGIEDFRVIIARQTVLVVGTVMESFRNEHKSIHKNRVNRYP